MPFEITLDRVLCKVGQGLSGNKDVDKLDVTFYANTSNGQKIWIGSFTFGKLPYGEWVDARELGVSDWRTRFNPQKYDLVVHARWAVTDELDEQFTWELAGSKFSNLTATGAVWKLGYKEDQPDESWIYIETKPIRPETLFTGLSAPSRKIASPVFDLAHDSSGTTMTLDGGIAYAVIRCALSTLRGENRLLIEMPGLTPLVEHRWLTTNITIVELSSPMIETNSTVQIIWIPARVTNISTLIQRFQLKLVSFFTGADDSVCRPDLSLERRDSDYLGCVETFNEFDRGWIAVEIGSTLIHKPVTVTGMGWKLYRFEFPGHTTRQGTTNDSPALAVMYNIRRTN
jgi:hypothetical protein